VDITDTNNLIWEDGMSDLRDIATLCKEIDCLTAQVNTLRNERNEARREVCNLLWINEWKNINAVAAFRNWDCFKENNNERR
jgi:hypothetical protein